MGNLFGFAGRCAGANLDSGGSISSRIWYAFIVQVLDYGPFLTSCTPYHTSLSTVDKSTMQQLVVQISIHLIRLGRHPRAR